MAAQLIWEERGRPCRPCTCAGSAGRSWRAGVGRGGQRRAEVFQEPATLPAPEGSREEPGDWAWPLAFGPWAAGPGLRRKAWGTGHLTHFHSAQRLCKSSLCFSACHSDSAGCPHRGRVGPKRSRPDSGASCWSESHRSSGFFPEAPGPTLGPPRSQHPTRGPPESSLRARPDAAPLSVLPAFYLRPGNTAGMWFLVFPR